MGRIYNDITETVGRPPLIRRSKLGAALPATVVGKAEFFNPLAGVRDRIGLAMIEAAEAAGRIAPGTVIIEPPSGNAGIALDFVCAARGYRLILTMPVERRQLLRALQVAGRPECDTGERYLSTDLSLKGRRGFACSHD